MWDVIEQRVLEYREVSDPVIATRFSRDGELYLKVFDMCMLKLTMYFVYVPCTEDAAITIFCAANTM